MKKKFFRFFYVLSLVALFALLLASCAKDAPPSSESDTTDPSESTQVTESESAFDQPLCLDLSSYRIVRSATASSKESASALALQNALQAVGLEISLENDSQSDPNPQAKEILIGNTNREETKTVLESTPKDQGYAISFSEQGIVIVARTSSFLEEAVSDFSKTYIPLLSGGVLNLDSAKTVYGAPCVPLELVKNGVPSAQIVRPMDSLAQTKQDAIAIATRIERLSSVSIPVTDEFGDTTDLTEIVVGLPDRDSRYTDSLQTLATWKVHEYGILATEKQALVLGHTVTSTSQATATFNRLLDEAEIIMNTNTDEVSSLTLYLPTETKGTIDTWLGDFPHYDKGSYQAAYEYSDGAVQTRYLNVDSSSLDGYIASLEAAGFACKQDNTNDGQTGNRFVTCVGEEGLIHVSYLSHNKSLTVHSTRLANTVYLEESNGLPEVQSNSTLAVMTLDYSKHAPVNNCDPRLNAGGLSYVFTLKDGRFIILDGGCSSSNGTQDCDILYTFLQDQTKLVDEKGEKKVVIAAWIFTHDSPDHHEAFLSFVPKYCKSGTNITIEYMIYNNGDKSVYSEGYRDSMVTKVPAMLASYMPNCKRIHPLPGQKITFADVEIEFLYTIELLAPKMATDANDASMLFRMKMNEMTVLFTGDAVAANSDLTAKIYGSYLNTDMMQINHHGTTGMTVALYNAVNPLYTLWSTSETCFVARTAGVAYPVGCPSEVTVKLNKRVIDELNEKHNTTDVSVHSRYADGPVEILTFHADKTITEEIYVLPAELTPELPPFVPN